MPTEAQPDRHLLLLHGKHLLLLQGRGQRGHSDPIHCKSASASHAGNVCKCECVPVCTCIRVCACVRVPVRVCLCVVPAPGLPHPSPSSLKSPTLCSHPLFHILARFICRVAVVQRKLGRRMRCCCHCGCRWWRWASGHRRRSGCGSGTQLSFQLELDLCPASRCGWGRWRVCGTLGRHSCRGLGSSRSRRCSLCRRGAAGGCGGRGCWRRGFGLRGSDKYRGKRARGEAVVLEKALSGGHGPAVLQVQQRVGSGPAWQHGTAQHSTACSAQLSRACQLQLVFSPCHRLRCPPRAMGVRSRSFLPPSLPPALPSIPPSCSRPSLPPFPQPFLISFSPCS